jgi:hypothetical protein
MKSVIGLISAVVLLVISVKPCLHYLRDEVGMWAWGTGVLAYVAALGACIWIATKMGLGLSPDKGKNSR